VKGIVSIQFVFTYVLGIIILASAVMTVVATDTLNMTTKQITSCTIDKWLSCDEATLEGDILSINISSRESFPIEINNITTKTSNNTYRCTGEGTLRPEDTTHVLCGAKPYMNVSFPGVPTTIYMEYSLYNLNADSSYTRKITGKVKLLD